MNDPMPSIRPPAPLTSASVSNPLLNARFSPGDFAEQDMAARYLRLFAKKKLMQLNAGTTKDLVSVALEVIAEGNSSPSLRLYADSDKAGIQAGTAGDDGRVVTDRGGPYLEFTGQSTSSGSAYTISLGIMHSDSIRHGVQYFFTPDTSLDVWVPYVDNATDLGSSTRQWKRLYLTGGIFLNGDDGDSGQVLTSGGAGAAATWTTPTAPTAASQAEQETATEAAKYVAPATQQFHPSAAKCWGKFTANSTTIEASYNITSVADTATGRMTVTIATDFSGADWAGISNAQYSGTVGFMSSLDSAPAAGTCVLEGWENAAAVSAVLTDPVAWMFLGLGDQ